MRRYFTITDRKSLVASLKSLINSTNSEFAYDISQCVKILEGEDTDMYKDLKEIFEEILAEKETLFIEKAELLCELDLLRWKMKEE